MIGFITLTPAGYVLDSAGNPPELYVNPGLIAAVQKNGLGTTLTLTGGTFNVAESIEQIEALIVETAFRQLEPEFAPVQGSGTCAVCGCMDLQACTTASGPCHWANAEHTLCSACADLPITEGRQ